MAATADRTTIKAAIDALVVSLRANLVADPPTSSKPFRRVEVTGAGAEAFPHPFLGVKLIAARPLGVSDGDKLVAVSMALQVVVDVSQSDPHGAMLDPVGAVADHLDSLLDAGVLEGAEGFDDGEWKFQYPSSTSGRRVALASASQSFVVKVERGQNRVPAS